MKTNNLIGKWLALFLLLGLSFAACRDEEALSNEEANDIIEDAVVDGYFEDVDDLSNVVLMDEDVPPGGRVAGDPIIVNDGRLGCAEVTLQITSESPIAGIITIDFGDSCLDVRGNKRKGIIKITFEKRWFVPGATRQVELVDFAVKAAGARQWVALEGIRIWRNLTNSTENIHRTEITLTDGKATWEDGSFATREHSFVRSWIRNNTNSQLDQLQVEGQASGTTRRGADYEMAILEKLVYKRECVVTEGIRMAVDGVKQYSMNGKTLVIDFGDGECDRIITITVNGQVRNSNVGS